MCGGGPGRGGAAQKKIRVYEGLRCRVLLGFSQILANDIAGFLGPGGRVGRNDADEPTAETLRRRGGIVGRDETNATNGCAVAGQSVLAGGRRGGEPSGAGLDCEHDGS